MIIIFFVMDSIGDIDNQENRNTVTFSASHSSASLSVTADLERLSVTSCPYVYF